MNRLLVLLTILLAISVPSFAQTSEASGDIDGLIEILRSDVRTEKAALLTVEMELTEAQAKEFWPLQRDYEEGLAPISDRRIAMIKSYAEDWGTLSDDGADKMAKEYFSMHKDRLALRQATYKKMSKALGSLLAARFLQIESAIQNLIDLQIAAELPILE